MYDSECRNHPCSVHPLVPSGPGKGGVDGHLGSSLQKGVRGGLSFSTALLSSCRQLAVLL